MTRDSGLAVLAVVALAWLAAGTSSQAASRTDIKEIVVEEALATTVPPSFGGGVDQPSES